MRSPKPGEAEYSLRGYGRMIADEVRMRAYRDALAASIEPGDSVLDLGAGTGIVSLLACQLGAGKVYAVEPSDALAVARQLAEDNGCADRIEFLQAASFDVHLPAPADVLVSDLRGVLPLHGAHIPAIVDARRRLLAPGGAQVPARDRIRAQVVTDATLHDEGVRIWRDGAFGLDLRGALRWAAHQMHKADLSQSVLLGEPQTLCELDYTTVESPDMEGQAGWTAAADQVVHGLGAWYDTDLVKDIGYSNAPDQTRTVYGQMFFPFQEPVSLARGDEVTVRLAAKLVDDAYVWRWKTTVRDAAGAVRRRFAQSSFQATPVNPARLTPER
jgi:type I protein arginine methyltransferase